MVDSGVPRWKDLPEVYSGFRCSWDYFNSLPSKAGKIDQLGTLNFLTAERRKAAREEITSGEPISLELPLDFFSANISAFGGRPPPVHTLKHPVPFCHEDYIEFNTQGSSQWDGLRHFAIRSNNVFYNNVKATEFATSDILGIQTWTENGGIIGRGVLIDFKTWAEKTGKTFEVNGGTAITLDDVKAILKFQNTQIHPGDILIFRTGWIDWYKTCDPMARHKQLCEDCPPGQHHFIELFQEARFVEWLWDNQVAAVAGDQPAFECTPPPSEGFGWLHEHLLAALGCPIGELWDTESLAKACQKRGSHSFFFASSPLAITGGAASTLNAVAIL